MSCMSIGSPNRIGGLFLCEKIKKRNVDHDIGDDLLRSGYYAFGANQLQIIRGLEKVLDLLEREHGLEIQDNSKVLRKKQ